MRIEDLLEFEGLTADMVRAWLRAKGWTRKETATWIAWVSSSGTMAVPDSALTAAETLSCIAAYNDLSPQSLLREINPRLRPGWPADEEVQRHAFWMVRTLSDDGIRVLGSYVAREWKKAGINVECWPCDAHGHKVRLATDDKRRG